MRFRQLQGVFSAATLLALAVTARGQPPPPSAEAADELSCERAESARESLLRAQTDAGALDLGQLQELLEASAARGVTPSARGALAHSRRAFAAAASARARGGGAGDRARQIAAAALLLAERRVFAAQAAEEVQQLRRQRAQLLEESEQLRLPDDVTEDVARPTESRMPDQATR